MCVMFWTVILLFSAAFNQVNGDIQPKRDAEYPELIGQQYFLNKLLEEYGDGKTVTVNQIQDLLEKLKKTSYSHEAYKEAKPEQNPGQVKVQGPTEVNGSCGNGSSWMKAEECRGNMCLSAKNIFQFHGLSGDQVNASVLHDISPTILYTAQQPSCEHKTVYVKPKATEVWGYSILCVTVINLCSLMGMAFMPLMQKSFYKKLLMFMVALAVGTLSGSSLLFLIPECFDMASEDNPFFHDYVWKCTTILGGIYMFFLVERLLKNIMDWRKKLVKFDSDDSSMDHVCETKYYSPLQKNREDLSHLENAPLSSLKTRAVHRNESLNMSFSIPKSSKSPALNREPSSNKTLVKLQSDSGIIDSKLSAVTFDLGPEASPRPETVCSTSSAANPVSVECACDASQKMDKQSNTEELINFGLISSNTSTASIAYLPTNNSSAQLFPKDQNGLDNTPATPSESDTSPEDIKSVAWMVIFGDGLHNFIDGLSIGAAFAKNILAGVSVSLAVVCEELPHELGDFAILLNSGMSLRQAMVYNFLSACMCYLGLAVGILVGEMTSGSSWIFALAGGMFLYISLVDMLPEVNHASEEEIKLTGHTWRIFFLQNAGLLSGYGIMLVLAVFSDKINFDTDF